MFNAREVLKRLEILESLKEDFTIEFAYEPLNIFDWFRDTLTRKDINDMIEFLQNAIELGYTGYVCFKVGDSDTASGMWARKPNNEGCFLYHTFSPDCDYYTVYSKKENGSVKYSNDFKTITEVRNYIEEEL